MIFGHFPSLLRVLIWGQGRGTWMNSTCSACKLQLFAEEVERVKEFIHKPSSRV